MTQPPDCIHQDVNGDHARVAGRDYIECTVQHHRHWRMTLNDTELDALCLTNEWAFAKRFGKNLCQKHREQALTIIRECELTEAQVRHLFRTGAFGIRKDQLILLPSRSIEGVGFLLCFVSALVCLILMMLSQQPSEQNWATFATQTLALLFFAGLTGMTYWTFVLPSQLARSAQARLRSSLAYSLVIKLNATD